MCKKYCVNINYDRLFALFLFKEAYLNEIIPEIIWETVANKFKNIEQRDKIFRKKLKYHFR